MTDSNMREKAVDIIVVLNAAFTNIRLYPPTSAMITKSLDNAESILKAIFEREDSIIMTESEGNLVISGHRLDENDNKRPQVSSFVQQMIKQGIKSIAFKKGLEKDEILSFLEVVVRRPEDLRKEGSIQDVMSGKNIRHIFINETPDDTDEERHATDRVHVKAQGRTPDREQLMQIKEGIEGIIKGEERAFRDRLVMQALPKTVMDLISHGREKTAEAIIQRLGSALLNENEGIRAEVSLAFARIGAKLLSEKRASDMIMHLPKLIKWLRSEKVMLPAYKHLAHQLQLLSQYLIMNHRHIEAMEILNSFRMINSGESDKDESIRIISADALEGMARDEIINSLSKDFKTGRDGLAEEALEIFILMGQNSVGVLLSLQEEMSGRGTSVDSDRAIILQKKICDALVRIGSRKAVSGLRSIVEEGAPAYNAEVREKAFDALEMILKTDPDMDDGAASGEKGNVSPAEEGQTKAGEQPATDDEYLRQLSQVDQYVKNKDPGSAVKLLFEMTAKYAGEKDFEKAEGLRDRLMEVDPMALNEIIKSGEIIEEQKNRAIDQDHLELWSELYKNLTEEETSTLFFAMKSVRYETGHTIFKKGDHDSRLYFINKGQIKLVHAQGDKEVLLRELKSGDLLGEDTFFSLSLSTSTAITLTPVELNYLERNILSKWELKSYGIEPKLHDYYLRTKKIHEKGHQKRVHERIPLSGKVRVQFMDASGFSVGEPVTGALSDISQGGMSFYLNIKKEKITRLFLEPRLNLKFSLNVGGSEQRFDQNGTMVAAIPHYYDYSIHVKFDNRLDKQLIDGIRASKDTGNGELELLFDS